MVGMLRGAASFGCQMPSGYSEIMEFLSTLDTAETKASPLMSFYNGYVIKKAPLHEAMNMLFVGYNTTVPVPEVLCIGPDYIVMRRVAGMELVWDGSCNKDKVMSQLGGYMRQLHGIGSSELGNCSGSCTIQRRYDVSAACKTIDEFNELCVSTVSPRAPVHLKNHLAKSLGREYSINFAHGDIAPRNILVDSDWNIVAIVDWQQSGFYPEYWDYVCSLRADDWSSDWESHLSSIITPYGALHYVDKYIGMIS
ncbi:hypothetical protein GGI12_005398 [Dipsacomyces acuminosporus]|nr:hypothetical protein GGI12_005398 [Dipsacomyces acuminosporus]